MPEPEDDALFLPTLDESNSRYTFREVEQKSFFGNKLKFILAQSRTKKDDMIAIRIRSGSSGLTDWMNELQVYLLPNFGHDNILTHYGSDKRYKDRKSQGIRFDNYRSESKKENAKCMPSVRIEYWLMNKYYNCGTLREYLKEHTLTWSQMINIAKGIVRGLHYLHENADYQEFDVQEAINGFIESTNGALKKVTFVDQRQLIHMRPHLALTIIHRNLTSMNIVLREDLTPCIWNFGYSIVYHPFQPSNNPQYMEPQVKETILTSQYSPPEVIQAVSHLTLFAMKSIDMYACGMLFWELISRTVLPKLESATEEETQNRSVPDEYHEPFEEEFKGLPVKVMLEYAVCKQHARPHLKQSWLIGRKTNRFVQTIMDLWDQDFDARIQASTVLNRLKKLSLSDHDTRYRYKYRKSNTFVHPTTWPPDFTNNQGPLHPEKCLPNIKVEDIETKPKRKTTSGRSASRKKQTNKNYLSSSSQEYPLINQEDKPKKQSIEKSSARERVRLVATVTGFKEVGVELDELASRRPHRDDYPEIEVKAEITESQAQTEVLPSGSGSSALSQV